MSPSPTVRETELAARRRLVLLAAVLAVTLVPLALGAWHAWPLLGLPLVLSFALSGPTGMALVASVAALAMALVSANPVALIWIARICLPFAYKMLRKQKAQPCEL